MRLLLATPVFSQKEYAVRAWLARAETYTYQHDTLLVDNSPGLDFYLRWMFKGAPIERINHVGPTRIHGDAGEEFASVYLEPLAKAAEFIRQRALSYDYWLNLDVDEYGWPELLDDLLAQIGDADVLVHATMNRQLTGNWIEGGFGCCLFSRRVLKAFSFDECPPDLAHDIWFFRWLKTHPEFTLKQTRGTKLLMHLDGLNEDVIPRQIDPALVPGFDLTLYHERGMVK